MKIISLIAISLMSLTYMNCGGVTTGPISSGASLLALGELKNTIKESISDIEYAYNSSLNSTANQIENLINTLMLEINNTTSDVNDMITIQQYQAFVSVSNLADDFDKTIKNGLLDVNNIVLTTGQIMQDLPFVKNEPRLTKNNVPFFIKNHTNNLVIDMVGIGLDDSSNYIEIEKVQIKPQDQTSISMSYKISNTIIQDVLNKIPNQQRDTIAHESDFVQNDKIIYLKGKTILHYKEGWWIFEKIKQKVLPFTIKILPNKIGTIEIVYTSNELTNPIETVTTERCSVGTSSTGWKGKSKEASDQCNCHTPTKYSPECGNNVKGTIIPGSIRIKKVKKRHGGGSSIKNITSTSFTIKVTAKSEGKPYGGGGSYSAVARYEVSYPCKVLMDKVIPEKELIIGTEFNIDLSHSKKQSFKRAIIRYFDGTISTLTNLNIKENLIELEYDPGLRQIIIKPIKIEKG